MAMIPADASVCTQKRLLVHLSGRASIYEFNRKHQPEHNGRDYIDADYFLLSHEEKRDAGIKRHKHIQEAWQELEGFGLEVVAESPPWTLYRSKPALRTDTKTDG